MDPHTYVRVKHPLFLPDFGQNWLPVDNTTPNSIKILSLVGKIAGQALQSKEVHDKFCNLLFRTDQIINSPLGLRHKQVFKKAKQSHSTSMEGQGGEEV
jgi:hypothetical protein